MLGDAKETVKIMFLGMKGGKVQKDFHFRHNGIHLSTYEIADFGPT